MSGRLKIFIWILILQLVVLVSGFSCRQKTGDQTKVYSYKIINQFPHDTNAFTQGLAFEDGILYEGTGKYGESQLRKVDLQTGKVLKIHNLTDNYFGEGICIFDDKIIQLTWKSETGFVYDKNTFDLVKIFYYQTEGWGITHDGKNLIISDGTDNLYFLNPKTFTEVKRIEVRFANKQIIKLNELEYIDGKIFANIWMEDRIAIIDPANGKVTAWINLTGLLKQENTENSVLNGIAFDEQNKRLFVTGKYWPTLFEIELVLKQ